MTPRRAAPSTATTLTNITDVGNPSEAYDIWCSGTIDDWGQLTNLGGTLATSGGSTPGGHGLAIVGVTVSGDQPSDAARLGHRRRSR